jgi:hypothetical protein
MWAAILHCAIVVSVFGSVSAQQTPRDILASIDTIASQTRDPAVRSLETFRKLVNQQNYRAMGFDSLSEVRSAVIGDPLVAFYLRLDHLRSYQPGGDPLSILSGGVKVVYSVLVGHEVRASIVLDKGARGWTPVSYGGPNYAKLLYRIRAQSGPGAAGPGTHYFAVNALALGVDFLGLSQQAKLVLIPLLDDHQGRWKAGVGLPADRILGFLVADAKAYNGLPR